MTALNTRADLMAHPAFADLNTDSNGNPCVWENYYSCRACSSEQEDWSDVWSCQCDDECPACGRSCEPEESVWLGPEDLVLRDLWELLPEAGTLPQTLSDPPVEYSSVELAMLDAAKREMPC